MTLFCPSGPSTVCALHVAAAVLDVYPFPVICATYRTSKHCLRVCVHKEASSGRQTDLLRPDARRASCSEQDRFKDRYSCCCSAVLQTRQWHVCSLSNAQQTCRNKSTTVVDIFAEKSCRRIFCACSGEPAIVENYCALAGIFRAV